MGGVHDVCWCCVQSGGGIFSEGTSAVVTVQSDNSFINNTAQVAIVIVMVCLVLENPGCVSGGWK